MLDKHSRHSVLREVILEHLLIGALLRALWQRDVFDAEVLRSEFDAGGYDIVVSRGVLTRHIQLKATILGGKRTEVGINLGLTGKPSGCIVWMFVTDDLRFDHFFWFGDAPGQPLPDTIDGRVVRHTKGDGLGNKLERPNLREVRKSAFEHLATIEDLLDVLLGELAH
ncbi:hypothetical protein [uncultured Devosia sp.]|uniref:hypothetical protein n=1 Tax=uncultured Devosia sp. TaxID=211434 RepID=UPI0035CBE7F7